MAEILRTARLLLREHVTEDAVVRHRLHSDPLVMKYTCEPLSESLDAMRVQLASFLEYNTHQPFARWITEYQGEVIGWAGPKYLEEVDEIDLGYRFLPAHWGQGFATEACHAVVSHCFNNLDIERLVGFVNPANRASVRVLEKCGFAFEQEVLIFDTEAKQYALNRD